MNEPIDVLTEALRDAEDALDALRVGVTAEVPLLDGALIWAKSGAGWILLYRHANGDTVPLLKTGKRVRIEAAGRLGALLESMRAAADRESVEVQDAICAAKEFANHCRRCAATP